MCSLFCPVYVFVALVTSNYSRCSLNSIDPMVLLPLPELLYYYQTWCFLWLRGANYNDWIRIHGELSYCWINTYIHLNGSNFTRTQYRLREDLHLYKFCYSAFWKSSFRSCLLSVDLHRLRLTEQRFERNNRYTTCFIFAVLLLNKMIHRMTKKTPSTINQSFRLDMKHIWLKQLTVEDGG